MKLKVFENNDIVLGTKESANGSVNSVFVWPEGSHSHAL